MSISNHERQGLPVCEHIPDGPHPPTINHSPPPRLYGAGTRAGVLGQPTTQPHQMKLWLGPLGPPTLTIRRQVVASEHRSHGPIFIF